MKTSRRTAVAVALLMVVWVAAALAADGKVNINTATADQLSLLPRVGATVAARIIEFREKNGKFKKPEELLLVSGIGDRTFDLIRPYVSVDGETTLREKVSASDGSG